MADILDQNEVDALLNGVADGTIETETDQPPQDGGDLTYDLTNPEKVIRGKMVSLPVIHNRFVKLFQTSLGNLLRRDVEVQVLSFEVMKYIRFIETIPLPASLGILRVEPDHRVMIIVMDAIIVFTMMDILCGGTGSSHFKVEGRDFTSIEQKVIDKVATLAATDLTKSWKSILPLDITLEKTEINPQFVTQVEKTETLVVFTIEVVIEDTTCNIRICIPYSTIEPYRTLLSGEGVGEKLFHQNPKDFQGLLESLRETSIEVVAEVGRGTVTFRDLLNLKEGDIIPLDREEEGVCDVYCEGVWKFQGFAGQHKGNMAVQIRSAVDQGGK